MAAIIGPVFVTGGNGLLGRAVLAALADAGISDIHAPGRDELDLTDRARVQAYVSDLRPQTVIHLASLVFGLGGNSRNQMRSLSENSAINDNLLTTLQRYPARRFFFAGTVASYPYPYAVMPLCEEEFFNGLPHRGEFGYAMAKRQSWPYLEILAEETGLEFTYGIFTNLYGPGDRFDIVNGHVVPSLVAKAHAAAGEGGSLRVWGDGSATRDFLFVTDAARAVIHCLSNPPSRPLVNISSAEEVTIRKLALTIAANFDHVPVDFDTTGAVGIPKRVIDNSRLLATGFSGFTSLEEGIASTCQWYAENQGDVRR
ncbi:MAG: NAD-dependent epimerase/dehydratase family protein [Nitratireductor sp.]